MGFLDNLLKKFYKVDAAEKQVSERQGEQFLKSTVDKEKVAEVLNALQQDIVSPSDDGFDSSKASSSREFKQFRMEEDELRLIKTVFEKACKFSGKIMPTVKPDADTELRMREDLEFLWFNVEPKEVMAFGLLLFVVLSGVSAFFIVTGLLCLPLALFFAILGVVAYAKMPSYPGQLAQGKRMRSVGEMPMVLLYLVMFIRNSPVMESAVRFAAVHLDGPIAMDFRKLIWDVQTRKYVNMHEALLRYTHLWMNWNREFAESIRMVQSSTFEPNDVRRTALLDQSVEMILSGTAENMKHYAQGLKMPITVIHALGILLPIMGLVMFPMVVMFMSDSVSSFTLFFAYDIMLFTIVYMTAQQVMSSRPETFSALAEQTLSDLPPEGSYRLQVGTKKVDIPMFWPSLVVTLLVASPGLLYLLNPAPATEYKSLYLYYTLSIIWSVPIGVYLYSKYTTEQRMKVRESVVSLESEFSEALFQMGNRLMSGIPIEIALGRSTEGVRGAKITELISRIEQNMTNLGLTFEKALFDPKFGAMRFYPSKLIKSIMKVLVESSKKGTLPVATSMLAISKYLKNIHTIEEDVNDLMGETASSMKFQGLFLAPAISGVVVGLGIMIMQILLGLHSKVQGLTSGGFTEAGVGDMGLFSGGGFLGVPSTSPEIFQLIVGIYMLEVAYTLSILGSKISNGSDKLMINKDLGSTMFYAAIVYTVAVVASSSMFTSVSGVMDI